MKVFIVKVLLYIEIAPSTRTQEIYITVSAKTQEDVKSNEFVIVKSLLEIYPKYTKAKFLEIYPHFKV